MTKTNSLGLTIKLASMSLLSALSIIKVGEASAAVKGADSASLGKAGFAATPTANRTCGDTPPVGTLGIRG
jgi:hypothetical protein